MISGVVIWRCVSAENITNEIDTYRMRDDQTPDLARFKWRTTQRRTGYIWRTFISRIDIRIFHNNWAIRCDNVRPPKRIGRIRNLWMNERTAHTHPHKHDRYIVYMLYITKHSMLSVNFSHLKFLQYWYGLFYYLKCNICSIVFYHYTWPNELVQV